MWLNQQGLERAYQSQLDIIGAIHGRLLTAWAAAGVLGPVLVNYLREYQLSIGVERAAMALGALLLWACWKESQPAVERVPRKKTAVMAEVN